MMFRTRNLRGSSAGGFSLASHPMAAKRTAGSRNWLSYTLRAWRIWPNANRRNSSAHTVFCPFVSLRETEKPSHQNAAIQPFQNWQVDESRASRRWACSSARLTQHGRPRNPSDKLNVENLDLDPYVRPAPTASRQSVNCHGLTPVHCSLIHLRRSTNSACMIAICPAGPPKLMKPSLSQKKKASWKEMAGLRDSL